MLYIPDALAFLEKYIFCIFFKCKRTDATSRWVRSEVERRVQARTAALVKANQILQAELAQQLKQGQQLRSLLKETHHRVKNNLQIVSSLLGLQASYTDDAQVIETFNKAQQHIRSMSLIHHA